MNLAILRRHLEAALRAPSAIAMFNDAKERWATLCPFATPNEMVTSMRDASFDAAARDFILRAVMLERRASGERLWSDMLTLAFLPMIGRLRHGVAKAEDATELVLSALFEALDKTCPDADFIALRLRRAVERRVFHDVRAERKRHAHEVPMDGEPAREIDPIGPDLRRWDAVAFVAVAQERLGRDFDVVVQTAALGEGLRGYVLRVFRHAPAEEQARAYERLRRRRSRALKKLRTHLTQTEGAME